MLLWFEHSLALPFFGTGMKTDLFQSCGHCWVFQICWHVECSTFTVSSFRIWNSSTGIPSPPLALFVVMLPKAHLTLNSRMYGSRWVIMLLCLSGSWRSFFIILLCILAWRIPWTEEPGDYIVFAYLLKCREWGWNSFSFSETYQALRTKLNWGVASGIFVREQMNESPNIHAQPCSSTSLLEPPP